MAFDTTPLQPGINLGKDVIGLESIYKAIIAGTDGQNAVPALLGQIGEIVQVLQAALPLPAGAATASGQAALLAATGTQASPLVPVASTNGVATVTGMQPGRPLYVSASAACTVTLTRQRAGGAGFTPVFRSDGTPITMTFSAAGQMVCPYVEFAAGASLQFTTTAGTIEVSQ